MLRTNKLSLNKQGLQTMPVRYTQSRGAPGAGVRGAGLQPPLDASAGDAAGSLPSSHSLSRRRSSPWRIKFIGRNHTGLRGGNLGSPRTRGEAQGSRLWERGSPGPSPPAPPGSFTLVLGRGARGCRFLAPVCRGRAAVGTTPFQPNRRVSAR